MRFEYQYSSMGRFQFELETEIFGRSSGKTFLEPLGSSNSLLFLYGGYRPVGKHLEVR